MAQNENEIVIPQHLIDNGRVKINVGDKITLNVGTRELMDGSKLNQKNPYLASSSKEYIYQETGKAEDNEDYEEQIIDGQKREYTVVGIMKRPNTGLEPYSAPGYTAVTYSNDEKNADGTDKITSIGTKLNTNASIIHFDSELERFADETFLETALPLKENIPVKDFCNLTESLIL